MIGGSVFALFLEGTHVFILPILFGAGMSTMLVQSIAIIAALIGENSATSAFVYAAIGLAG